MKNNISRILIETIVRKTLRDIKDSPERSSRNLIDMALHFSAGHYQHQFFEILQEMLSDEHSAYYALIRDTVSVADSNRILAFGMNLGYNSCTRGAETIRTIEQEQHFNIPWSLALEIDGQTYAAARPAYHSILEQGKALGIYAWLLYSFRQPLAILPLAAEHPDCAFLFICPAESITDSLLDEADAIHNLMFAVPYGSDAPRACALLRERGFLYSLYFPYKEENAAGITSGDFLGEAETLHPVFTLFLAEESCPYELQAQVYAYLKDARQKQLYRTCPFDLRFDNQFVDRIISDNACTAAFDRHGHLHLPQSTRTEASCNLFQNTLTDIFRSALTK